MLSVMEFTSIEEYMLKSGEGRRAHLKLDEPCIEIGGHSSEYRGLLCFALKTTMPRSMKIHLCHACHNSNCANTNHLYWGTPQENKLDADKVHKSFYQRNVDKYGEDFVRERCRASLRKATAQRKLRRAEADGVLSQT